MVQHHERYRALDFHYPYSSAALPYDNIIILSMVRDRWKNAFHQFRGWNQIRVLDSR